MKKKRNEKTERNHNIYLCRINGASYKQIAENYGISICRVRQIIDAEEIKAARREQVENGR